MSFLEQKLVFMLLHPPTTFDSLKHFGKTGFCIFTNKMATLSPKESGKFIVANAKYVKVLDSGVDKCASEVRLNNKNLCVIYLKKSHLYLSGLDF